MRDKAAALIEWVNARFPLADTWNKHVGEYYAPKNFNFWYMFGGFSLLVLVNQIVTGIWLSMYYTPTDAGAFASVEHIMRNVRYGWLIRYMHSTGASAFFIVVYLHMYRGIIYGSYKKPRELIWLLGMVLFVLLVAEVFTGYVLPWGQMSYWATKVFTSLVQATPFVGEHIMVWLQGDYSISGVTLHRFFTFHIVVLPPLVVGLVFLHIVALHKVGSNNPDGIEIKENLDAKGHPKDGITFHPYYTVKDLFGVVIFLMVFSVILFFYADCWWLLFRTSKFHPSKSYGDARAYRTGLVSFTFLCHVACYP